jgi:nucleotide-binding universal stress UspA family protein
MESEVLGRVLCRIPEKLEVADSQRVSLIRLHKLSEERGESKSMIDKILVPTDGSEHAGKAIEYACELAVKMGATVCLLHVVPFPPPLFHEVAFAMPDFHRIQEEDGKRIIEKAERETKKRGVKNVRSAVTQGNPASRIIEFAKAEGVDLIVMGNRGLSGVTEFVLGSVSHRVTHLADCTVTIVK